MGTDICIQEDCSNIVYARQLCTRHYQKARVAGTLPPSIAKDRPCAHCGQLMKNRTHGRAKFCSYTCKEAFHAAERSLRAAERRVGRICAQCSGPIPETASGKAKTCSRPCGVAYQNAIRAAAKLAHWESIKEPCRHCGGEIPSDRHAGSKYCSARCKGNAHSAIWRKRAPGYMRKRNYGITPEQFNEMQLQQEGRCAICRTDKPGGKGGWHVDHCHATGKIRGLLCHHCNVALGNFKDNVDNLRAAIAYLTAAESLPEAA